MMWAVQLRVHGYRTQSHKEKLASIDPGRYTCNKRTDMQRNAITECGVDKNLNVSNQTANKYDSKEGAGPSPNHLEHLAKI